MAKKIDLSAMASKGGKKAAANITAEERSERAKLAAESRWGTVVKATHVGDLVIGSITIPCAVLEDDRIGFIAV